MPAPITNPDALRQMQTCLAWLEAFIQTAVARMQALQVAPPETPSPLLSDDALRQMLQRGPLAGLWDDTSRPPLFDPMLWHTDASTPLLHLTNIFGLDDLDIAILLIAAAPDYDRRYARFYAYLQGDAAQQRPTVDLMMNLLGDDVTERFAVRARLLPEAPLRRYGLLDASAPTPDAPFLAHALRLDARMVAHLLGDDTPDPRLRGAVARLMPQMQDVALPEAATRLIGKAIWDAALVYLRAPEGIGRRESVAALCAQYAMPLLSIDLARLTDQGAPDWTLVLREGYLTEAVLLLHGWEHCLDADGQPPRELWQALLVYPYAVFINGQQAWEPRDVTRERPLLRLIFTPPPYTERLRLWATALRQYGIAEDDPLLTAVALRFRLGPAQIARAAHTAADLAASRAEENPPRPRLADVVAGAQAHAGLRLGAAATLIPARHTWDDLVLPAEPMQMLRELRARVEYAHIVGEQWGFQDRIAPRTGLSALFTGPSGTGKTLAAEIIAGDAGLPLYRVNLAAIIGRYVGETEKNLAQLFTAAAAASVVLFFDEADALLTARAEDAALSGHFLHLIEDHDGIVLIAADQRAQLEPSLVRRLDFVIPFPMPEAEQRRQLWQRHLPAQAALAEDIDLTVLAERYPLAGAGIRRAALAAAYLAAAADEPISMTHLHQAIRREYQKTERAAE